MACSRSESKTEKNALRTLSELATLSYTLDVNGFALFRRQSKPNQGDIQRISALTKEIDSGQRELQKLVRDSAAIEQAIKDLQEQILEIGGVRLRAQKSKVDGIRQMLEIENDKITKSEVHLAKARKDSEKHAKALEANEEALEASATVLEQIQMELGVVRADVEKVQKTVDQGNARFEAAKDELEAIKSELEEKLEFTREFRKKEVSFCDRVVWRPVLNPF